MANPLPSGSKNVTGVTNLNFKEFSKKEDNSSIWYFFWREEKGQLAKCKSKECFKILKVAGGSTTPLHNHLRHVHKQCVAQSHSKTALPKLPGSGPLAKIKKLDNYFEKEQKSSLSMTLARLTAKDGLSFSIFCTSEDLRRAVSSMGFSEVLTKSPSSIREIVMSFSAGIRDVQKSNIKILKDGGVKFCAVFDEWSSSKNRRFLNIIISGQGQKYWDLGLARIKGSMTAEVGLKIVKEKLECYDLCLEKDIVSIITDGTSVMTKVGLLSPTLQQLCLAHGLQLCVTDVLYQKYDQVESNDNIESIGGDDDLEVLSDNENSGFVDESDEPYVDITHVGVGPLIKKVRKIVKMYKRSPLKNESLQKHVKADFEKELQLILDTKTRWNSLHNMLERFYYLKDCVKKSLIDLKEKIILEDWELLRILDVLEALGPIKVTVEALCRRDANLLTADAALNFAIGKLEELQSGIGQELAQAFRRRISERRTDISGVFQYLHTRNFEIGEDYDSDLFTMPSKSNIAQIIKSLLSRLTLVNDEATLEDADEASILNSSIPIRNHPKKKKSALQDELQKALQTIDTRAHTEKCQSANALMTTIKKEMSLFEAGGARGHHLQTAFDYIQTIKPTSVESERAFSSVGYLCNKVRSSLRDDTLDELCFLRSYFKSLDVNT